MNTHNRIFHAFNELIQRKAFDDITVLEICRVANVSTSSFYRHYKDKYDVMNDNYKRILNQYMHSANNHNFEDIFINLFKAGKELQYLKKAFDYTGINSLGDFVYSYSYQTVIDLCDKKEKQLSKEDLFQLDVFCGGCSILYKNYIQGKYDLSPVKAGKTLYKMLPNTFKITW